MISQQEYHLLVDQLINDYASQVISYNEYRERLEELGRFVSEEDV